MHALPWLQGAAALYAGALAVLGLLFHLYAAAPGCRLNIFFIAWTLVLGIGYTLLSGRRRPRQAAWALVLGIGYSLLLVSRPPMTSSRASGSNTHCSTQACL